ncbi:MAG: peroxiredoxin family protein [Actinobacteria bacterium]|nr:peroxiredoxin family protein [Actinomycetota bacterium]
MTAAPSSGDPAPELALPTLDDDRFLLRAHRGRPVIVSFLRHAG